MRYNGDMKYRSLFLLLFLVCATACAPVLSARTMDQASRVIPLQQMQDSPDLHRGKLYVFGGTIASAKTTDAGSLLELVFTTVDSRGTLQDTISGSRVLAFMPQEQGLLDPVIFSQGRKVTVSGLFDGIQRGTIGDLQYSYPYFMVTEIYLWPKEVPRSYEYYPSFWWGPSWGFGVGGWWR